MARALRTAGKDVTLDTLPMDTWSDSRLRVQLFRELEGFLRQHLPAD
jgi:hypothetical protein